MRETKKKIKYGGLMIALSKDVILPKTLSEINALKASQISKFLRSKGLNIIPIVSGTKTPKAGFNLELYFEKMCDAPIKDTDSIALIHGNVSDTLCVDCDVKSENYEDALRLFAKKENTEKFLSKNMVVKTPRKGIHIIVRLKDGKYPRNITYNGPDGNHIDLRSQRAYSLLPPSKYLTKEQHLGNYKFLSSCREPREISLAELETKLAQAKFFPPRDSNNKDIVSGYDFNTLRKGKFQRGERRVSMNSLYCKYRIKGKTTDFCEEEIRRVNSTCEEKLSSKELETNCQNAESYFQSEIKPNMQTQPEQKEEEEKPEVWRDILSARDRYAKIEGTSKLLIEKNRVFKEGGDEFVDKVLDGEVSSEGSYFWLEVRKKLGARFNAPRDDFDENKLILNCKNCFVNLETGKIEADNSQKSLMQIDTDFRPELGESKIFVDALKFACPDGYKMDMQIDQPGNQHQPGKI